MTRYPVAELFASINGESVRAGEPAVFVRFRGCNLACSYCDTKWANRPDCPVRMMTAEEIAEAADQTGIADVTLTGGEPLMQKELDVLISRLTASGHRVELETNGSVSVEALSRLDPRPVFTLDYKLPGSGMESSMLTEKCSVFISPVFGKIDPADIVAFLLERRMNGVRLQLQLHKFIWDPEKRGV